MTRRPDPETGVVLLFLAMLIAAFAAGAAVAAFGGLAFAGLVVFCILATTIVLEALGFRPADFR